MSRGAHTQSRVAHTLHRETHALPKRRRPAFGTWLQSHQGQPLSSQENSLRREQGFNALPPQQQQRSSIGSISWTPCRRKKRQRWIGRNENFERLGPGQRQPLGSAQELRTMDPERKQQVRGAFRVLREHAPEQPSICSILLHIASM